MQLPALLLTALLAATLPAASPALPPPRYDDDLNLRQLRLEDLEQELDLNRPPQLPTHYDWRPAVAVGASVGVAPPSLNHLHEAAQLERLHQLRLQHQQLSAGYALPNSYLLLPSLSGANGVPNPPPTPTTSTLLKPIVPYDLAGVQYLNSNALDQPLPPPPPPPFRLPFRSPFARPNPSQAAALLQSKQFAYAPTPHRSYAAAPRIPLPYPPSFVSITTRRPYGNGHGYVKPFRPSQPDPTPDLFAGRSSKSLLDSYIPSWEVVRLLQRHHQPSRPQPHTLAYPARLFKRDSSRRHVVKKSL